MKGMEMMLASMLGISQDEMRSTIGNAIELLGSLDNRFKEIERKQDEILRLVDPNVKCGDEYAEIGTDT